MAVELATAYVSLVPSFKGGAKAIRDELEPSAEAAGTSSGAKSSAGFKDTFSKGLKAAGGAAALFGGLNFLKDAFSLALDQAQLPGQLQQKFGLTASLAAESAKTAGDLYAKGWGDSLGEVADSVGTVDRALNELGTSDDTARVTAQAQALAKTFGLEVPEVVNSATQLVRTGMAPTMEAAFDTITAGFQSNADSGKDLLDTLVEYPAQFQKLGVTAPVAMGLMNQAMAAGARNSDLVADAIKEFSIRAVDGSKTTAEGFQAIGLNASQMAAQIAQGGKPASDALQLVMDKLRGMTDPVAQSQAAVALFGTQAEDLGASLYAMNPATAAASGGMENMTGAAQRVTDQVGGSLQASLSGLSRSLESGLASALTLVVPMLSKMLDFLQPVLPILGPMALAIGAITVAQWAWNTAMSANPIGLIVAGIAAVIAVVILIINHLGFFREIWDSVWKWCSDLITTVTDWIGQKWDSLVSFLSGLWSGVKEFFGGIWDGILGRVRQVADFFVGIWRGAVDGISGFFRGLGSFIGGIWDGIGSGLKTAVNWVIDKVNWLIGGVNKITGAVGIPAIPKIPKLAKGGIVTGPTLAMVGEGRESEAVMPLSKLEQFVKPPEPTGDGGTDTRDIADAVADALSGWSVQLDSNGLARLVNNANIRKRRRG